MNPLELSIGGLKVRVDIGDDAEFHGRRSARTNRNDTRTYGARIADPPCSFVPWWLMGPIRFLEHAVEHTVDKLPRLVIAVFLRDVHCLVD